VDNTYLVIPTIRNLAFLQAWGDAFDACHLIIVEDHREKSIDTPRNRYKSIHWYTWQDIRKDFGSKEWIFSRNNAGIRSYGFWKAYRMGAKTIITLDDDCYPADKNFVSQHVANLSLKAPEGWTTTYPHADFLFTRGIPYSVRNTHQAVISHGLWTNKIDLDAQTQLCHPNIDMPPYPPFRQFIPKGAYFPMCTMNLAFRRETTPLMYLPMMGNDPKGHRWGYDRFDDIWAGIFAKKIIDHLGLSVVNGSPFVEHRKASDAQKNLQKEKRGLQTNEKLWKLVQSVQLIKSTPAECYRELAKKIPFPKTRYFDNLRSAMRLWSGLFQQ